MFKFLHLFLQLEFIRVCYNEQMFIIEKSQENFAESENIEMIEFWKHKYVPVSISKAQIYEFYIMYMYVDVCFSAYIYIHT